MTNFSKTPLSLVEVVPQYADMYRNIWSGHNTSSGGPQQNFSSYIISIFTSCVSIIGLVGNGIVICLLGFYIKRTPFTMYILNLAVADFGALLFGSIYDILILTDTKKLFWMIVFSEIAIFMYIASQLLLTAISIDRCVSVLFPFWHRWHRPRHLSIIVCALIWVLSFLSSGSIALLGLLEHIQEYWTLLSPFIAAAVLCLPLVMISTMILLFKVFCKSQQPWRRRPLTIVFLTLLFFLVFAFPLNAIFTINCFTDFKYSYLIIYGTLCASFNSCVNPVIYFLVGRKKMGQRRKSLKFLLQRAFQEEEDHREGQEQGTAAQTSI
ncbi:mas-related G-protein coupled receptor member X1-like [Heteronotia binoei]|uniref:mas-related G-protein coupled receptor member X1-like n=1 Tax=Heteronotia binoei TaxID=13085 RepID=UPI00292CDA02|nr:mas-related G-protein coupled receptor member X1-like [Heteronotia binoei]